MSRRGFVIAGLIGALGWTGFWGIGAAHAQSVAKTAQPSKKLFETPLTGRRMTFTPMTHNGSAIVTLRINDKIEARFVVSTGNPISVVSPALVKKLGLPIAYRPEAGGTKTPIVTFAQVGSVTPKDTLQLTEVPFMVDESGGLNETTDAIYDGIIGGNILFNFAVLFDYEQNQVLLLNGKLNESQLQYLRVADGLDGGVPMTPYDPNNLTFTVPVRVGKNTFPVLISTTSPITMVADTEKKLNLDKAEYFGAAQDTPPYLLPVSDFDLADGAKQTQISPLNPFDLGVDTASPQKKAAVLGLDYLTHFRVIIDYPARKFYAAPLYNPTKRAFSTEASRAAATRSFKGGSLMPSKSGQWMFTRIEPNGELDKAGIKEGDLIETVNGHKADGLTLQSLKKLFHSPRAAEEFGLLRDGKPVKAAVNWE